MRASDEEIKEIMVGLCAYVVIFVTLHTVGVVICGLLWVHSPEVHRQFGPHFIVTIGACSAVLVAGLLVSWIVAAIQFAGRSVRVIISDTWGAD